MSSTSRTHIPAVLHIGHGTKSHIYDRRHQNVDQTSANVTSANLLPKMHKINKSGQPVLPAFSRSTKHISEYLHVVLQPLVRSDSDSESLLTRFNMESVSKSGKHTKISKQQH